MLGVLQHTARFKQIDKRCAEAHPTKRRRVMRMFRKTLPLLTLTVVAAALLIAVGAGARAEDEKKADGSPDGARVGQPAPDFALKDQDGKDVKLADYKGKIVVIHWFNADCPFVQDHYKQKTFAKLGEKYGDKGVVQLAIDSSEDASAAADKKFADANGVKYPILVDAGGKVAKAYQAKTTPHMFVIDKDGKVVYKGAIDNDPDTEKPEKDRVNYVAKALDEILAGKPVSTPETKSYGCGVHYK